MKTVWQVLVVLAAAIGPIGVSPSMAQGILFDFENAPIRSSLPVEVTVGGITAHLSATGQGFFFQEANTMGFTPLGFSGLCIYPTSVFASDLRIGFSEQITNFSILYAPQELACDSSARMKVTAYLDGAAVGANTAVADPPGTWPSATLAVGSTQGFNSVVVHYDAPPPTGGDWGPIFMADNMVVTPGPPVLRLAFINPTSLTAAWPGSAAGVVLQRNAEPVPSGWQNATNAVSVIANECQVTILPGERRQFYRLKHP